MTSNPIKGPSPSDPSKPPSEGTKTSGSSHKRLEKVEKVGEIDPEQQSKARKFRALVDEEVKDDGAQSNLSSPMDLFSKEDRPVLGSSSSFTDENPAQVVPSPSYSSPPRSNTSTQKPDQEEPPLPKSDSFWSDVNEPIENKPKPSKWVEKTTGAPLGADKNEKEPKHSTSAHLGIPIKEIPSNTPPSNPESKDSLKKKELGLLNEDIALENTLNKKEKETPSQPPSHMKSAPLSREEDKIPFIKEEKKYSKPKTPDDKLSREDTQAPPSQNITPQTTSSFLDQEGRSKDEKKNEKEIEVKSPSTQPLPVEIIPIATAATANAMPYLKPETLALFYQMVGTIHIMAKPSGVTRTEIILNANNYAQSKFYGASIILEKYASAPDSFNIRLTGSNEAVAAFNQNIPSLMKAFQKGNFSFRVGRIEAEYKSEKSTFRRKEKKEGNDLGGDVTDMGK